MQPLCLEPGVYKHSVEKCSLAFQQNISMTFLSLNYATVGVAQCTRSLHFYMRSNVVYTLTGLAKLGGDQEKCMLEAKNPVLSLSHVRIILTNYFS